MGFQDSGRHERCIHMSDGYPPVVLFLAVIALLAILWPSGALGAAAKADDWIIECADCPRYFDHLSPRALQVDGEGDLHVVYGAEHLYHAWTDEEIWQSEIVDDKLWVGSEAALAIDQADGLHVVYYDEGAQALRYATDKNNGWQIEELVGGIVDKTSPTIAVDRSGKVHVTYFHASEKNLVYANLAGNEWQFEIVDDEGAGSYASLAVDMDGYPHISYACEGLCYAVKGMTGWRIEPILSDSHGLQVHAEETEYVDLYGISLALDNDGKPSIAFGSSELTYATRSTSGWQMETVDSFGFDCTLVLDAAGTPHISYAVYAYQPKGRPVIESVYAVRSADGWVSKVIGPGSSSTLAWRTSDGPHIVVQEEMVLRHVRLDRQDWQTETVEQGGYAGSHAAMALDSLGHPRIASFDQANCRTRYAEWNGSNWRVESLGPCVDGRIGHTIGTNQVPHLFTVLHSDIYPEWDPVIYAFRDETGWHSDGFWPLEIYAPDFRGHALTLDGLDQPHVSLGRLDRDGVAYLDYGYLSVSGEWTFENVRMAAGKCIGDHTDLALDRSGGVHIAYVSGCPSLEHDLKYAHKDGDGWHFDTVDSRGDVGQFVSLALDVSDHPRMSYYDATNGDLVHAVWTGSDWQIELVDRDDNVGQYTSLAIDGEGFSHISYYDATNGVLRYARQDETGWQIEVVDDDGDVGLYSSLALYGRYPAIAYYDQWRHDLKVARLAFLPTDFQYLPSIRTNDAD